MRARGTRQGRAEWRRLARRPLAWRGRGGRLLRLRARGSAGSFRFELGAQRFGLCASGFRLGRLRGGLGLRKPCLEVLNVLAHGDVFRTEGAQAPRGCVFPHQYPLAPDLRATYGRGQPRGMHPQACRHRRRHAQGKKKPLTRAAGGRSVPTMNLSQLLARRRMRALTKAVYDSAVSQEDEAADKRVARLLPGGATVAALILVLVLITAVSIWKHAGNAQAPQTEQTASETGENGQSTDAQTGPTDSPPTAGGQVTVYVSGAVASPEFSPSPPPPASSMPSTQLEELCPTPTSTPSTSPASSLMENTYASPMRGKAPTRTPPTRRPPPASDWTPPATRICKPSRG